MRNRRLRLRDFGLTLTLVLAFLLFWVAQAVAGWKVHNDELAQNGEPAITIAQYLCSGHFLEATAENWESEFLQMGAFVCLTSFLFQRGSPESNDPDTDEPEPPVTAQSPWPAKAGSVVKWLFSYSLSIAFALLFLVSFFLHAVGGAMEYSREQLAKGRAAVSTWEFLGTWEFWFQSFQNWQSEFLAIGCMVYFAVFLRHKGSPESKAIATPTWAHEE